MISVSMYGRLGNHLWQYAVCRTVAEKNNYQFHIPRTFLGEFFGCDLGVDYTTTTEFYPCQHNEEHIQPFDPKVFDIADGTQLDGFFQSERYILDNRANIIDWFRVSENSTIMKAVDFNANTCIIHFRGTDYKHIPDVFLPKKYYDDSIQLMKQHNPLVQFAVITDDQELARQYFPHFDIYQWGVIEDFMLLNKAKYLIIPNSSFAWWAAWLNETDPFILAPKYWLRHNISSGWWSPSDSLTSRFHYVDRQGIMSNYYQCLVDIPDDNYFNYYT